MSDSEERTKQIFAGLRQTDLGKAPLGLKTRVLAELRERRATRKARFWKWAAILSPVTSAAVAAVVWLGLQQQPSAFEAAVNRNILVKIEVADLRSEQIAFAEIELPDGVRFESSTYPELREKRSLVLAWSGSLEQASLPLVVRASDTGLKSVKVRFLNKERQTVEEKTVKIRFTDEVSGEERIS